MNGAQVSGMKTTDKPKSGIKGEGGTLPASWYSTRAIYELERRAIFAKQWLMVSHELRFQSPGNYVKYTIAGYPFFIIRNRQGDLKAFLNVCRHRAFPIVLEDEGKANILACKYHGWSYGLNGNLAKAPKFDVIEDFDKTQYSLFQVHLKVDKRGFIWVNLDAAEEPEVPWGEMFNTVDEQPRLQAFDMKNYRYDHSWDMYGDYNWKTLIDNFNECYHCLVAHPAIAATVNLDTYHVNPDKGYIVHHGESKPEIHDPLGMVAPTYLFPNAAITMTDQYFYLMRVVPLNEGQLHMQYEVYRNVSVDDATFMEADETFKQVEREDKFLCTNVQKNINAGTYVTGPLHPHNEKGVLFFKSLIKTTLMDHRQKEKARGHEISPAKRLPNTEDITDEEMFCRDLCQSGGDDFAW